MRWREEQPTAESQKHRIKSTFILVILVISTTSTTFDLLSLLHTHWLNSKTAVQDVCVNKDEAQKIDAKIPSKTRTRAKKIKTLNEAKENEKSRVSIL